MDRTIHAPVKHIAVNPNNKTGFVETLQAEIPPGMGQITDHVALQSAQKILIKRPMGLGDILMMTPTLRQLHKKYAHLDIHVAVNKVFVPLIDNTPYITTHSIEGLIEQDVTRPQPVFDEIVELNTFVERSPRRKVVGRKELFAEAFGMSLEDSRVSYRFEEGEQEWADEWWEENTDPSRPAVALAPLGTDPKRSWPPSHIKDFAELASQGGAQILWIHSDDRCRGPVSDVDNVVYVDNLSIREVAPILQRCSSLISTDSGIYHLAAAVQKKKKKKPKPYPFLFVLFGQWPPDLRLGGYSNCLSFYRKDLDCVPCHNGPAMYNCDGRCMRMIKPKIVWDAVKMYGIRSE